MSHLLEMPDELYAALQAAADASGTTPLAWIAAHVATAAKTDARPAEHAATPRTLADLFAGRVGHIRSGGTERLSEECGAKFTDYVDAKRRGGCL